MISPLRTSRIAVGDRLETGIYEPMLAPKVVQSIRASCASHARTVQSTVLARVQMVQLLRQIKAPTACGGCFYLANNPNFDTNAPLFEVRGKVILEGVMHHIRPTNLDLRL